MQPRPLILHDAFKQFRHDQEKIIAPEKTVERFKQRVQQSGLDILDEVVRIDNGRLDIPVYFSLCGSDAQAAIGNVKQMGKGATPAQAQASAVMELGERFSLFSFLRRSAAFEVTPLTDLKQPAMGFESIARSVQDTSDDLPIARQFFADLPLQWTWAHNLTKDEMVMIPFNWFWTINEFNGASAGNGVEEALCQGISEVVERHVSALICRNHDYPPLIDPDSITDGVALELIQKFRTAGVELYLSDFTSDMGIPTIGVLAWDPTTFPQKSEIVWTAGTTPNPAKALCRALTEVAQLAGDFNSGGHYVASGLPKFNRIQEAVHITRPGRSIALNALPDLGHPNIKIEVERCIQALSRRNMEVFTIDVRHPQLAIPALYTLIPGALFRERAAQASVAMICAKIVTDTFPGKRALERLMQFNSMLPGKYFIQFYLGQIQLNLGRYEEAERCLRTAVELQPADEDLASIYTYLAISHKERGQYQEALKALSQAEKIDPRRTDTLNLMGFCYYKLKAHAEAVDCFRKVVGLNPNSAIDYANLAVNYRALGDTVKAVDYYQLALALNPGIDFARDHLAQLGISVAKVTQP